ncbi:uncharacterized protein LOC110859310 [Folsomia candida]|uniref:Uncharacterized protein n=1 Tax=Folsomia candida TaxID=158441 RepID=A0A226DC94_FOLCA|nr:uncharacterized protein LOC110859310 [Folsomia candida]OXA42803.1 hypothetical protein Fcan01_22468 [Folsomia candida]
MLSKLQTVVAFIAAMVVASSGKPVTIQGVVSGAISCGGSSGFVSMELTDCTAAPCNVSTGTTYEIGISFLSQETTSNVNWLLYLYYPNGGVNRIADKTAEGSIVDGIQYRVADNFVIPDRFNGIDGELSVMLMNGETGSRVTCGIFPVVIAPNAS